MMPPNNYYVTGKELVRNLTVEVDRRAQPFIQLEAGVVRNAGKVVRWSLIRHIRLAGS